MSLNGASQKVVLSQLPLYEQHPHRTFEAWFQTAQPTAVQTIYCAGIIGPDSAVWYKTPSSAGPGVGYYAAPNTPWLNCSASFSSLQNEWHHLAAVTSASSGFELYIDGSFVHACPGALPGSIWGPLQFAQIGAYKTGGGADNQWFHGLIDEVRFWDHARTPLEIVQNMCAEVSAAPGLLAAFHFNGDLQDAAGGHHGSGHGGVGFVPATWCPPQPSFTYTVSMAGNDGTISLSLGTHLSPYFILQSSDPFNATLPGLGLAFGLHISLPNVWAQVGAAMAGDPLFSGQRDINGAYSATLPGGGLISSLSGQTWWCVGVQQVFGGSPQASNIASITLL